MTDLISVLVPTYNMDLVLARALQSVALQTHRGIEVIVVDDGSTDNTATIVDNFARELTRDDVEVHYHQKTNGGRGSALNYGIDLAQGNFITFLDADDTLPEQSLETRVIFLLERPEIGAVFTDADIFKDYGSKPTTRKPLRYPAQESLAESFFYLPKAPFFNTTLMMRRTALDESLRFNESYRRSEDTDFVFRLLTSRQTGYFPVVTYHYHVSSQPYLRRLKNRIETAKSRFQVIRDHVPGVKGLSYAIVSMIFECAKLVYDAAFYRQEQSPKILEDSRVQPIPRPFTSNL